MTVIVSLLAVSGCATFTPSRVEPRSMASSTLSNRHAAQAANQRGLDRVAAGDLTAANEYFRTAVETDVGLAAAWNNLAITHLKAGRYYDAAWALQSAIKLAPEAVQPKVNLGLLFERVGWRTRAIEVYETALNQRPEDPAFLRRLARAKIRAGVRDGSLRTLLDRLATLATQPDEIRWARAELEKLHPPSPSTEDDE